MGTGTGDVLEVRIGSICSGIAGIERAVAEVFTDAEIAWFAETDLAASRVLEQHYPGVRNLGDITEVKWGDDGSLRVDMITAGFP